MVKSGDYVVLTFDGHGWRKGRLRGWRLFRESLSFDALFATLSTLPAGVRVLVVSSTCYSGTVTKETAGNFRELPRETVTELFNARLRIGGKADSEIFDLITVDDVAAHVRELGEEFGSPPAFVHLAACAPDQRIVDGTDENTHSPFIRELLRLSADRRRFADLERELRAALPGDQQPEIRRYPDLAGGFPQAYEDAGAFRIE